MATTKSGGSSSKRSGGISGGGKSGGRGGSSRKGASIASRGQEVGNGIVEAAESAVSEVSSSFNWSDALERIGLSEANLGKIREAFDGIDVSESVDKASEYLSEQVEKARDYTRKNPKTVAGGAAGVLVGASLLAYALTRSGGGSKKKGGSSSKKSGGGSSSKKSGGSSSKKSGGSSSKTSGGSSSKKSGGSSSKKSGGSSSSSR